MANHPPEPPEPPRPGTGPNQTIRIAVALITIVLTVLAVIHGQDTEMKLLYGVMVAALGVITVTDIEARRIPNLITGPASLTALIIGAITNSGRLEEQLIAGFVTGLVLLIVAVIARGGLGMGDVKLGAMLGCFLGRDVADALFLGFGLAAVFVIGTILVRGWGETKHRKMFLGPYLAIGAVPVVFFVTPFIHFA